MKIQTNEQIAMRVSIVTIIGNVILSVFKLIAGLIGNSGAMISDAVHSMSDVFSTFVVIIGVKIANKESDEKHQYGHERVECVAAIILAFILFVTGIGIGYSGIMKILTGNNNDLLIPSMFPLVAAIISIIVKEWMYWYTKIAAKKIDSGALMADAWHHRSDSFSSIGSFIGILGAKIGFPILDPIASVIICIFIIKAAYDIFIDAINKMIDKSCDEEIVKNILNIINEENGVLGIDSIKTRLFGDKIYVDIEIQANRKDTLENTHEIAQNIHDKIEEQFPKVKHCMVHVNPAIEDNI